MTSLRKKLEDSPALTRALPFAVFVGLTFLQGRFGPDGAFWIYLLKTVVGAWMIWLVRPLIAEMKWRFSWEGLIAGVAVFVLWVGIDGWYPQFGAGGPAWNPVAHFGAGTFAAGFFILVRIAGSALVVPPLEEVFFRSLLYRYLVNPDFRSVPLGQFGWMPFLITSALFAVEHSQWLAGLLCGFAFQALVCWRKRLGDAITAHAVTNLLLGLWVVWKDAWNFW